MAKPRKPFTTISQPSGLHRTAGGTHLAALVRLLARQSVREWLAGGPPTADADADMHSNTARNNPTDPGVEDDRR